MKKGILFYLLGFCAIFILSGCTVRTYQVTRDRVDQNLGSGNRGYLMGQPPTGEEAERKATRSTRVVEVELRPLIRFEKSSKGRVQEALPNEGQGQEEEAGIAETGTQQEVGNVEKYTVEKGDTLQKISTKFYGTSKKWMKIFNANKDVLKTPNKIHPGQVINIPVLGNKLKEPVQNLK